jgi:hypothetical protein
MAKATIATATTATLIAVFRLISIAYVFFSLTQSFYHCWLMWSVGTLLHGFFSIIKEDKLY